ncbi:sporulation histidine kinase inhibitor Sda [Tuberibacillus sp. Marseille-P3662]|nr:sporulation histidine kinase inhibitor Sda [Tuberibacillus sp. Marseille-P3662]
MRGLNRLSDELLMDSFYQAKQLELDDDFIELLQNELKRRSLSVKC